MTTHFLRQIIVVSCIIAGVHSVGLANTSSLNLNNDLITISGELRNTAKLDLIMVYSPASTFDKSKSTKECSFQEDQFNPNGADKIIRNYVTPSNNHYSLSIPTGGTRGSCEYKLDTVYLNINSDKVQKSFHLKTEQSVKLENSSLAESGLQPSDIPQFSDLTKITCDFATTEIMGFCTTADEDGFIDLDYEISNTAQSYQLDILDK